MFEYKHSEGCGPLTIHFLLSSIVGFADPFRVTCITSGVGMACGVAAAFLAERVGRRYLHNIGATCMLTCCIVVGIISVVPQNGASNTLLVAFTCLWGKSG